MIAEFNKAGNLPPGIHHADWEEFSEHFGINRDRRQILAGLKNAMNSLKIAGCKKVYVDGSFITSKLFPGDFDGCWETVGVDFKKLDPVFLKTSYPRDEQKEKYLGEFFPILDKADYSDTAMMDFFQRDKITGEAKGIVGLDL